ncbi:MAG: permease prefix domain 1-containing protein [Dehalococcoidia bacterium]
MTGESRRIDDYLDALFAELRVAPRLARRILAETEDHLREAAAREVAAGVPEAEAEARAIARFGAPHLVARRFVQEQGGLPVAALLPRAAIAALTLAGIGFLAIGVSGVAAAGIGRVAGKAAVAGDLPGVSYTAERCADFLAYHPEATSCAAAAVAHHFDEVVGNRIDAGVLGLLILAAVAVARWRGGARSSLAAAVDALTAMAGTAVFGTAGAALFALGLLRALGGAGGGGDLLAAGAVSLATAVVLGLHTVRSRTAFAFLLWAASPPAAAELTVARSTLDDRA